MSRIGMTALLLGALGTGFLAGCEKIFGREIPEQTLTVACGGCIFKQGMEHGCYWSAEVDGQYYAVNGPVPKDHDSHGPEGMCTLPRHAVVAGEIRGDQLFASKFDLLPVTDAERAAHPAPAAHRHE
jgi:hypothetical protein